MEMPLKQINTIKKEDIL